MPLPLAERIKELRREISEINRKNGVGHWEERMLEAGKVFNQEKFIADVRYEFRTTNKLDQVILIFHPAYFRIHPAMAISRYFSRGDMLTLHLRNGKKQNFFVESLGGKCRVIGGPH